jgi:hypothetical protein
MPTERQVGAYHSNSKKLPYITSRQSISLADFGRTVNEAKV